MPQEVKQRKARAPKKQNYDQILATAQGLTLEEKADLCKELKRQVNAELAELQNIASKASEAVKGL